VSTLPERLENRCLNCEALVNGRYCQVCGQENVIHATTFWGMLKHFVFDLLHFDGKFFRTILLLFTKPGFVPLEFIQGKRRMYLEPFKMYIFSSTIMFILLSFLSINNKKDKKQSELIEFNFGSKQNIEVDTLMPANFSNYNEYKNAISKIQAADSARLGEEVMVKRFFNYAKSRKIKFSEVSPSINKELKSFFPKALFFILPIITWFLQFLFLRKKMLFSEHGIFTLFSFSLVFTVIILYTMLNFLCIYFLSLEIGEVYFFIFACWFIYYLYKSFRVFYQVKAITSFFKVGILLVFGTLTMLLSFTIFILLSILLITI
jgi:hypothetical protein